MAWTIGKVAQLAKVTVRTLHHYDALGLVTPGGRSEGNYRLYTRGDLERLEQVLYFRALGFGLDEIAKLLDPATYDRRALLLMQRRLLRERTAQTRALEAAVERALGALEKGATMKEQELFEAFEGHDEKLAAEAEQKWGNTPEFAESARRTKRYTKQDWVRIRTECEAIEQELAMLAATGHDATDPECLRVAEKHRLHTDRYYYPCPHPMHVNLGEMYVADPRFTAYYEKVRPGLAQFLRDAIVANAAKPYVFESEAPAVKQVQKVRRR